MVALCNFEFRYAPGRVRLREMVRDGSVGAVEHVQLLHHSAGSRVPLRKWGWLFDRALGGGWVGAWASHAVDNLRYVFGTEVVTVQALLRTDVRQRPDDDGEMHTCTAEDGFTAAPRPRQRCDGCDRQRLCRGRRRRASAHGVRHARGRRGDRR